MRKILSIGLSLFFVCENCGATVVDNSRDNKTNSTVALREFKLDTLVAEEDAHANTRRMLAGIQQKFDDVQKRFFNVTKFAEKQEQQLSKSQKELDEQTRSIDEQNQKLIGMKKRLDDIQQQISDTQQKAIEVLQQRKQENERRDEWYQKDIANMQQKLADLPLQIAEARQLRMLSAKQLASATKELEVANNRRLKLCKISSDNDRAGERIYKEAEELEAMRVDLDKAQRELAAIIAQQRRIDVAEQLEATKFACCEELIGMKKSTEHFKTLSILLYRKDMMLPQELLAFFNNPLGIIQNNNKNIRELRNLRKWKNGTAILSATMEVVRLDKSEPLLAAFLAPVIKKFAQDDGDSIQDDDISIIVSKKLIEKFGNPSSDFFKYFDILSRHFHWENDLVFHLSEFCKNPPQLQEDIRIAARVIFHPDKYINCDPSIQDFINSVNQKITL